MMPSGFAHHDKSAHFRPIARSVCWSAWPLACVRYVSLSIALQLATMFLLPAAHAQYVAPPPPPSPSTEQAPPPPPPGPLLTEPELEHLVSRIALYPDPLLAHVLTASTYWDEIPEAAQWANEHNYLTGSALADAIRADNLPWDPSVLALLPFPFVLNMMAQDMAWTEELGKAVLNQRADVMDAVQRLRQRSYDYGYLRSSPYDAVVNSAGYIEILPTNPEYIYVPTYDPAIVYAPPPPGFAISAAIHFGPAVVVGAAFAPWGWISPGFVWGTHAIIIDRSPWNRVWFNRGFYVHPYIHPWIRPARPRIEIHPIRRR
jgi:Protein of unknown function (DUF3300)